MTPQGLSAIRASIARVKEPDTAAVDVAALAETTPAILWIPGQHPRERGERLRHGGAAALRAGGSGRLRRHEHPRERDRRRDPCQNPDGREADTRRNAYGFDLNRDVFARTQPETDGRVELWRQYPPVLLLDHHEFGYYRSFFPPNDDPVYHDIGEQQINWIEDIYGAAISAEFVHQDEDFFHGGVYDFFSPQYNDTGPRSGWERRG